jgi:hypothetical protein
MEEGFQVAKFAYTIGFWWKELQVALFLAYRSQVACADLWGVTFGHLLAGYKVCEIINI